MTLSTPTADLALLYDFDPATAQFTVGLGLTAGGDLAVVAGPDRLMQDVTRWLLAPQGSNPFDPQWGNPLIGQLLRPQAADTSVYLDMVRQAEDYFISQQASAAALGFLSTDEQVASITATVSTQAGQVTVAYTIVARSGDQRTATLPAGAQ